MPKEVNPKDTARATAYALWMKAPNPMVTFFKTLDVTNLIKVSRKRSLKFNMLLDYCIGRAAVEVKEFYILPVGDKLIQYDTIAVNTIVKNKEGEVSSCDLSYKAELNQFNEEYLKYTTQVAASCQDRDLSENSMVIGTSAVIDTELDGAVGMNSVSIIPFLSGAGTKRSGSGIICQSRSSSITHRWTGHMRVDFWKDCRMRSIGYNNGRCYCFREMFE